MKVIPFSRWHLRWLKLQPAQEHLQPHMTDPEYGQTLEDASIIGITVLGKTGVIACGGIVPVWQDRGYLWGLLGKSNPREFMGVHRAARHLVENCALRRLESYVEDGHEEGMRWLDLLGFECETIEPMREFANGRDCFMFARVAVPNSGVRGVTNG
jgi:hypothetical protein